MHHSPSRPSRFARFERALYLVRLPRLSLRGRIAPVVLVCGVLAGIALVLPSYAPAVTGADGALGVNSTGAASARNLGWGSPVRVGRSHRGDAEPHARAAAPSTPPAPPSTPPAPSSTVPAPAPVVESPPAEESTPAAAESRTEETAPSSSSSAPAPATAPATHAPVAAPAAGAADPSVEGQVLALVNQQRAAAGCGALAADGGLASVARAFSADMRDRGFFSHTDPDGLSPFDRGDRAGVTVLAENIAYGQPDPASVMTAWMNSAGHRANILNCSYTRLGVGVADGPGGPWWTQDFA